MAGALAAALVTLPYFRVREAMRLAQPVVVSAGPRDLTFFGAGWSSAASAGNQWTRTAAADRAELRLPLAGRPARVVLRLRRPDPMGDALGVALNGVALTRLNGVGAEMRDYELPLPGTLVRDGANRLELLGTGGVELWFFRIEPVPDGAPALTGAP